jgi:tetratricopeptide (TPR) repeat protein
MKRRPIAFILIILLQAVMFSAFAQTEDLTNARVLVDKQEYEKAKDAYKKLYKTTPADMEVYSEYLELLLHTKDIKNAEKLVDEQHAIRQNNPIVVIDKGRVLIAQGKEKKANEQFDNAVQLVNGDDIFTQQIATTFIAIGREDYALKTYERARDLLHNPYMYSGPLVRLYAKNNELDKAVSTLLEASPGQMGGMEDVKATLMELLGTDTRKMQQVQKAILKKINEQPENPYYPELLTWLYTQKDDWEGAMIQIEALDARYREGGERFLEFAQMALKEKKYEYALKSYDAVIAKGVELPYYSRARSEKLGIIFQQLQETPWRTQEEVARLQTQYEEFLNQFPQFYGTHVSRDYASLVAQYAGNPQKGIEILKRTLQQPGIRRDVAGAAKLQMGDYYILTDEVWEASLLYSQVDKDFREDVLGEEARFRNAKLSYYRGDFEWAQGQLSVLKASTTELIANDALYLSVLITENIPPDSNLAPLRRFAYADLLLFQNKDAEAKKLLDSITVAYPEHPLKDDILMQRAKLALKQLEYTEALTYLGEVYTKYGEDVLADDALYQAAEINEKYLKAPEAARKLYEKLVLEYPGSTFVQSARNKLNELKSGSEIVP